LKLAWWEDSHHLVVDSALELEQALAEIDASAGEHFPIAVLTARSGAELHIGLGHPTMSLLLWFPPGYEGSGSMHSVGDPAAAQRDDWEPPLTFFLFGHHSEFPRWSGVSKELALSAAASFLATNGRPSDEIACEPD
jgi:hypothetical protein